MSLTSLRPRVLEETLVPGHLFGALVNSQACEPQLMIKRDFAKQVAKVRAISSIHFCQRCDHSVCAEHLLRCRCTEGRSRFATGIPYRASLRVVAGAGFEPAIPRPRDYEPESAQKVSSDSKPSPPFWRFSKFSSLRASLKQSGRLCQISSQGLRDLVHWLLPALWSLSLRRTSSEIPMYLRPLEFRNRYTL